MKIQKGSKIRVEYEGKLEDGTIFDSSKHGDHSHPLEFEVGSGQIIKGFEEAVIGMCIGDEKEIKLQPSEAYGEHNPQLIKEVPKNEFPAGVKLEPGMVLGMSLPNGVQIPARIVEVKEENVTLDLNHPLAGKVLIFKIKILEVS